MTSAQTLTLKNRAELLLAGGIKRFYMAYARALEPHRSVAQEIYPIAGAPGVPVAASPVEPIPRVVWTYWNSDTLPLLIARCIDNWRRMNPGFQVRVLNDAQVRELIPDAPAVLAQVAPAKRADWIRLALLHRFGGIWIDASTVLTQSLDWVIDVQQQARSDLVAYYLGRFTTDPAFPVVESWFMAAPPGSRFAADALAEFDGRAIARTGEEYIECLREQGIYDLVRQNIDMPSYLSIHLAMQCAMRTRGGYVLSLTNAEDGPFQYHMLGQWRRTPLKLRLLFSRVTGPLPPVIKLRGPDRRRLDEYLARRLYLPDSLVGRYLMVD
ncbi:MAG: mannosyltransferase [Comamonadaceae bacterium]|nr:MAG: mannosyltransferase [Comamonadaceae bacterium]